MVCRYKEPKEAKHLDTLLLYGMIFDLYRNGIYATLSESKHKRMNHNIRGAHTIKHKIKNKTRNRSKMERNTIQRTPDPNNKRTDGQNYKALTLQMSK